MAFSNPIASPLASNAYINGLLWGSHWNDPIAGTRLKVYITGQSKNEIFDFGGTAVTAHTVSQEVTAFQNSLQFIENVCNIDFMMASSQADADIIVGVVGNSDADGFLGVSIPPRWPCTPGFKFYHPHLSSISLTHLSAVSGHWHTR